MRYFEIDEHDINQLDDYKLTDILRRLLNLEASKHAILKSGINVALNINTRDGGIDGTIKWENGPDQTDFIISRYTMFQCKATNITPSRAGNEVINKDNTDIKPGVDSVLSAGGSYVLFAKTNLNDIQITASIEAIRQSFRTYNKSYSDTAIIQIYDSSKIKTWVNLFLQSIIAVKEFIGRPVEPGFQTWREWGNFQRLNTKYFLDSQIQQMIDSIRNEVKNNGKVLRLVGLSGIGKTRLAYQAFKNITGTDNLEDRIIYINASDGFRELPGYITDFIRYDFEFILVVDDCEAVLHQQLEKYIMNSKICLITLDYNPDKNCCSNTLEVPRTSDKVIKQIIQETHPNLDESDLNRIIKFSYGFPLIAVILAQARIDKENDIGNLRDDILIDKLLGQTSSEAHKNAITACSLFEYVGFEGEASDQYKFIAANIANMNYTIFYGCIQDFIKRGLVDKRGSYIKVIPRPLAVRLAANWWERNPNDKIQEIITKFAPVFPGNLTESLCNNIPNLSFIPKAQEIARDLCGECAPFGQAEVLKSILGSRLFRAFVEVNPEATSDAIYRVFVKATLNDLIQITGDVRRNLIWALERLCFRNVTFYKSTKILLLFAASENESWSNNATGQFIQLFHVFLSGTEAHPKSRLKIITESLLDPRNEIKVLAIKALQHALQTHHFIRSGEAQYQGSQPPLDEWRPAVWKDAFDYWEEALTLLKEIVIRENEILSELAKSAIADNIRGLMQYGRIDILDKSISEIISIKGKFWPEALSNINTTLYFDSSKMPTAGKEILEKWKSLLQPDNLVDRLKLVVSKPPYDHKKDENGNYIDRAQNKAIELALELTSNNNEELLNNFHFLLEGEQRQGYVFGYNLAKSITSPDLFLNNMFSIFESITSKTPNPIVISGFLSYIKIGNLDLWNKSIQRIIKNDKLTSYYIDLIRGAKPNQSELLNIISLVKEGKLNINNVRLLSYGGVLDHLSSDIVIEFINQFNSLDSKSLWISLDILFMYCFSDINRFNDCKAIFKKIIISINFTNQPLSGNMDLYHWCEISKKLLKEKDNELAIAIGNSIFDLIISDEKNVSINDHYIEETFVFLLTEGYGELLWPKITEILKNDNPLYKFKLELLFSAEENKPNLIYTFRDDFLLQWCREHPSFAPAFVAKAINIFYKTENEYKLTPLANSIINEFGDDNDVLNSLGSFMGFKSYIGSIIPSLKEEENIYLNLGKHSNNNVRIWAEKNLEYIRENIRRESKREEEHDWGIY